MLAYLGLTKVLHKVSAETHTFVEIVSLYKHFFKFSRNFAERLKLSFSPSEEIVKETVMLIRRLMKINMFLLLGIGRHI